MTATLFRHFFRPRSAFHHLSLRPSPQFYLSPPALFSSSARSFNMPLMPISDMDPKSTRINSNTAYPQQIFFGPGIVSRFFQDTFPKEDAKAFIITGNSLATKTPLVKQVESLLGERHAGTFSSIRAHAPESDIDAATELIMANPDINCIISIGGGSPIDSAKVIAHRIFQKKYPNAKPSDAAPEISFDTNTCDDDINEPRLELLTHIAIPTTLAAAECSGRAGFTTATGAKTGLGGAWLRPSRILYDATFIHNHTPHWLVLSTGIRALDHAVELFYHQSTTIETHERCLEAAVSLFEYLPRYHNLVKAEAGGSDSDNNAEAFNLLIKLELASYDSLGHVSDSFSGPIGPSHSLGYALGSQYSIPHGITSCLTLAPVVALKYKTDPAARSQIDRMYKQIKEVFPVSISDDDKSIGLSVAIQKLVEDLGLATNLTHYKVPRDKAVDIASRASPPGEEGERLFDGRPISQLINELVESLY